MRDSIKPIVRSKDVPKTKMSIGRTNKLVNEEGYTYNEAGFTYNEVGVSYGGLYKYDIYQLINSIQDVSPNIRYARDFASTTAVERILYAGMPMGLLLSLTYTTQGTVNV